MGLDMYLNGEQYFYTLTDKQKQSQPVSQVFRLGYWRKHPDLHGYIVDHFADENADYQGIHLDEKSILQIINAIKNNALPLTTGFFFGESVNDEEQKAADIEVFVRAIEWSRIVDEGAMRSVFYRASW